VVETKHRTVDVRTVELLTSINLVDLTHFDRNLPLSRAKATHTGSTHRRREGQLERPTVAIHPRYVNDNRTGLRLRPIRLAGKLELAQLGLELKPFAVAGAKPEDR
jgi:hypothetical protein